jgi:hypothetical protein
MYAALRALGVYGSERLIEDMVRERSKAELGTITAPEYHSRRPVADYHPQSRTRDLYLVRGSGARE